MKRKEQLCISLSDRALEAVNTLKNDCINVSKYISNLIVSALEEKEKTRNV